ncbi:MAG: hypothetical protein H6574_12040 [Lewinellaceae bacterium]|nr:hypothetical protein [Saprospiraceae bacterium]MCB9331807.1 hypothetical protein [Lewinellaceae bacterium]
MTHPTGQFPNETYLNGLRDNPGPTLAVVYDEFRMPVIQAILDQGGTEESAAMAFQHAVNDAASMGRLGTLPEAVTFFPFLKALSLAHFNAAKIHPADSNEPATEAAEIPVEHIPGLPEKEALDQSRQKQFAWQKLQQLSPACRKIVMEAAESTAADQTEADAEKQTGCRDAYLSLLATEDGAPLEEMPSWAATAIQDRDGFAVWQRTQTLEEEWKAGPPAPPESNRIWRWAVGILLLVAVGYGVFQFYFRPKTAAEVFADNFDPPTSLLADLETRYGAEMGNDSSGAQPIECLMLLREADVYYQANKYEAALDPLTMIALGPSSICQSDAWFFLGIIQLKLEDPVEAIRCLAKIEDLGRYGEDLYWYQALAFVQLAKENPMLRDKARGAVERTLGNTRDPKRRKQAEQMLRNLSK